GLGELCLEKAKTPKTTEKYTNKRLAARYGIAAAKISPSPAHSCNIGAKEAFVRKTARDFTDFVVLQSLVALAEFGSMLRLLITQLGNQLRGHLAELIL
ncbi:hypothetical protein, partial [Haliea sp.]